MSECSDMAHRSTSAKKPFLCGVCEGFYGKPWTPYQRKELFVRMERMGMKTYLYAPKDDYKHRLYWRKLYDAEEEENLQEVISAAREHGVTFVYALSPGLDVTYSSQAELTLLKNKLDQVKKFGCDSFALLFDDIEPDLIREDEDEFKSVANAQASLTNSIYKHLGEPQVFLFCPTEYCTSRAVPDLVKSEYLKTLGDVLDPGIDVLWTGPKVVSRLINLTGIKEVTKLIKRPPVVWDNIHANDYDQTRMFLGPYDGRPLELRMLLRGVLTNPNCEFEANFIAMHTLAQWSKNKTECYPAKNISCTSTEVNMDTEQLRFSSNGYNPKKALQCAVRDWLPVLYIKRSYADSHRRTSQEQTTSSKSTDTEISMETDSTDASPQRKSAKSQKTTKKGPSSSKPDTFKNRNSKPAEKVIKRKMEELESMSLEELLLICDLFYLPYEHGPRAVHILKQAHWLISNAALVADAQKVPKSEHTPEVREWYEKAINFHECHKDLCLVVDKFVNIPNRDLLYQLYVYLGDMRSCLSLINSYIKWHGMGQPDKEPFRSGEQEPWVHRGGLYSEFRRLLPLEGQNDMFPPPGKLTSGNKVFTIRPYCPEDKSDLYAICRRSCDDGLDGSDIFAEYPELVGDECIGCHLEHYAHHTFVLEDATGLCGYVAAAPDVLDYQKHLTDSWFPAMRLKYPKPETSAEGSDNLTPAEQVILTFHKEPVPVPAAIHEKYPGFLQIQTLTSHVEGLNTPSRLMSACLQGLRSRGVRGVHTVLHSSQMYTLTFLYKLSFDNISENKEQAPSDILVLGRDI